MSLFIEGMEMPKEIEPALVIDFCEDLDGKRYARFYHYRYGGLTDWHEVLEIPEPHGRLIDADAMIASIKKQTGFLKSMGGDLATVAEILEKGILQEIENAPTIIPASEEADA